MIPKTPDEMPDMDAPAPQKKLPKPDGAGDDLATGEGGAIELPSNADGMSKDD